MAVYTLAQLSKKLNVPRQTLEKRWKHYPVQAEHTMIGKSRVYADGVLEAWHARVEQMLCGLDITLTVCINQGEQAARNGVDYSENPYEKDTDIRRFCAWCAGWNDEKKVLTQKTNDAIFTSQVKNLKDELKAGERHA